MSPTRRTLLAITVLLAAGGTLRRSGGRRRAGPWAILDIGLPGLSGLDVLRRLRARKSRVAVLMLTAFDTLADRSPRLRRT